MRFTGSLIAITALISSSAVAVDLGGQRIEWLTDACCTGEGDEAPEQAAVEVPCCCDLTPVTAGVTAAPTSAIVEASTDVPPTFAMSPPPVAGVLTSATDVPTAHARGPPPPSADLLTQRTSLLL